MIQRGSAAIESVTMDGVIPDDPSGRMRNTRSPGAWENHNWPTWGI